MKFKDYLLQLSDSDREKYAEKSGTTVGYLMTHLFYGYKEPRKKLRKALAENSNGLVSEAEIIEHFGFADISGNPELIKHSKKIEQADSGKRVQKAIT